MTNCKNEATKCALGRDAQMLSICIQCSECVCSIFTYNYIFTPPPSQQILSYISDLVLPIEMDQTEKLSQCIENLFMGRATQDANLFIQQYSESKECWTSSMILLEGNKASVKYFAANILYNKVSLVLQ